MKNLKKVLALGLALVMLLGMFTVAAAAETKMTASDLADWDTVSDTHKDAVALMVDLGIINGIKAGDVTNFQPAGNIDRSSWAKMVYYAATGSDDADAYLGTATGLNDIAGDWAESYISFLKAGGYISGDDKGNYKPKDNVTVAEACKMMLTVLGYDAEDRKYQNDPAWAGNIMTDAKRNGLMDNVDKAQTALVPLTRENAAEIVYNALNANTVEGIPQWDNGNRYITTYNKLATLGYDVFDLIKVTATVQSIDKNGYAVFSSVTEPAGVTTGNLNNKVKAGADVVGEEVVVYMTAKSVYFDEKGNVEGSVDPISVVSSTVAKTASHPDKVITAGISTWGDLTTQGTDNYVSSTGFADNCAFYLNGNVSNQASVQTPAAKRGVVTEFYLNSENEISVVKCYEYKVDKVENGDATTRTTSDGTLQVKIPGLGDGLSTWVDADKVTGYQGLVDGDVVLYYFSTSDSVKNYIIEKTEKITGKVSAANSDNELNIGGTKYKGSQLTTKLGGDMSDYSDDTLNTWDNKEDEFDFFLDKNGSICWGTKITESLDQSKVALVKAAETTDKALGTSSNLRAELVFADGSTEIVNVTRVNKQTVVDREPSNDKQVNVADALEALTGAGDDEQFTKFFNYKKVSNGYELIDLDTQDKDFEDAVSVSTTAKIEKKSDFSNGAVALSANASTTFIVGKRNENDDTVEYYTYKSFKNVPEMDASIVTAIATAKDTKIATYVYMETTSYKDDVPDGYVFIVNNKWEEDPELEDTYLVNIVDTDGTAKQMRVNEDLKDLIAEDSIKLKDIGTSASKYVGKLFEIVSIDENKVVSDLKEPGVTTYALESTGGDVVAFSNGDSWDYDDATIFVVIDMGWTDGVGGTSGEREEAIDEYSLSSSGSFDPEGFFNADDVDATSSDNGATYKSVEGVAIVPQVGNATTADYVYVVRTLW